MAAGIVYLLIWYGPDVIARHDIGNVTGPLRAFRLQQARDAARGRLLTLGAGLFAAGALIFTARNSLFAQRTARAVQDAAQIIAAAGSDGGSFGLVRLVGVGDSPGTPRAQDALGSDVGSGGTGRQLYRDGAALAGEAAGRYDPVDETPRARVSGGYTAPVSTISAARAAPTRAAMRCVPPA